MLEEVIEPVIAGDFDICTDSIQVQRIKKSIYNVDGKSY